MSTGLNGFGVEFNEPSFTAHSLAVTDPTVMRSLRGKYGKEWFLRLRDGKAYGLPLAANPSLSFGMPGRLDCASHLGLAVLAARINDALPGAFPDYEAFRRRPFAFLARRSGAEIVTAVMQRLGNASPLMSKFRIVPKYELDARLVEARDGDTRIGLIMSVNMRWEIAAGLLELEQAGIDLAGLYLVRRNPGPDERRLVGRFGRRDGEVVELSEAYEEVQTVRVHDVWVEGSLSAFHHCLKRILGQSRLDRFEEERANEEARFLTGPALDQLLNTMDGVLKKVSPLRLTPDLHCSFTGRLSFPNARDYRSVVPLSPTQYCFDPAKSKRDMMAWSGLERYGPYSRESFSRRSPRVLVICADNALGKVEQFVRHFRDGIVSVTNSAYPSGLARTFDLTNPQFTIVTVPLHASRSVPVYQLFRKTVEDHLVATQGNYSAAFVVVPDEFATAPDAVNPYLHTKAILLMSGIPVQAARLSKITSRPYDLAYICRDLSIAFYAKLGGTPWTVDHDQTVSDELVIGMGTCEVSGNRFESKQRHIGITTVFRGDGNYLLSNLSKECRYEEYPGVLKASTLDVLREVKADNGWRPGDTVRVVFHAAKRLRDIEVAEIVAECVREVGAEQNVEFAFLTISHDHPFKILDKAQQGREKNGRRRAVFVPPRGTLAQLGRYTRLLCTNGPTLIKRETTPLPSPVLIHLHPQSTYVDQTYLGEQVLKFTSLSWRSTLPTRTAVTIHYSELIAGLLARLRNVPGWSPTALNFKLRASKWFL